MAHHFQISEIAMADERRNPSHDTHGDQPSDGRDDFHGGQPENRPDSPERSTGAGREANPYDKLPRPPEDTSGEVF